MEKMEISDGMQKSATAQHRDSKDKTRARPKLKLRLLNGREFQLKPSRQIPVERFSFIIIDENIWGPVWHASTIALYWAPEIPVVNAIHSPLHDVDQLRWVEQAPENLDEDDNKSIIFRRWLFRLQQMKSYETAIVPTQISDGQWASWFSNCLDRQLQLVLQLQTSVPGRIDRRGYVISNGCSVIVAMFNVMLVMVKIVLLLLLMMLFMSFLKTGRFVQRLQTGLLFRFAKTGFFLLLQSLS